MQTTVLDRYQRRFGHQEPRDQRPVEVGSNSVLDEICKKYEKWLEDFEKTYTEGYIGRFNFALRLLSGLKYSPQDVAAFSLMLKRFEERKHFRDSGYFFSGLVELGEGNDFEIFTEQLDEPLERIGFRNRKNITVNGNAEKICSEMLGGKVVVNGYGGMYAGSQMGGGHLIINGYAGYTVGYLMEDGTIEVNGWVGEDIGEDMKGGTIIVNDRAYDKVGRGMENGLIVVKGDVSSELGEGMTGGEIHVGGEIRSISSSWKGGRIYHRGVLVRGVEQ